MAEVIAVVGVVAAAAQLARYVTQILSLVAGMTSDIKNDLNPVLQEIYQIREFILIAEMIQRDHSGAFIDISLVKGSLDDAITLYDILKSMSIRNDDSTIKRMAKVGRWNAKRKEISMLCANLEKRKASITMSGVFRILNNLETEPRIVQPPSTTGPLRDPLSNPNACGLSTIYLERTHPFIGRERLLSAIKSRLEKNKHNRLALFGLGGIGFGIIYPQTASRNPLIPPGDNRKSEVAIECAIRLRKQSPTLSVFWIHATSILSFEIDYLNIAVEVNLPGKPSECPQATVEDVKQWLSTEETGEWLMVVDDVSEESKQILKLLPRCPNGSIIFTTKSKTIALNLAVPHNVIEVEALSPVNARVMLLSRIGTATVADNEAMKVMDILQSLEYLPLAISHMGAFIFENSISISEYGRLYNMSEASKLELLFSDDNFFQQRRFTLDHTVTADPVAHTLTISFERIREHSPGAADLLCLMVCLDCSRIPNSFLLPTDWFMSDVQLVKALGVLKGYCLVTVQCDGSYSVHSLVYLAIRKWLRSQQSFVRVVRQAFKLVWERFSCVNSDTLTMCESYIPHAEAVLKDLDSERRDDADGDRGGDKDDNQNRDVDSISRAELAHRCSRYFQLRGAYWHAERLARKAVEWSECVGGGSRTKWTMRSDLATVLRYQGHFAEARTIDELVLDGRRKTVGEDHHETLSSLNNLGLTLQCLGNYKEAEMIHRQTLSSRERLMGKEHAETLSSMNNLAMSLQQQGVLHAAQKIGEELVSLKTKVLGAGHLDTLLSVNNLGVVLQKQGRLAEARKKHEEVLEGRERILGRKHPKTLMSLLNIGATLHGECQFAAAEEMVREVFDAYKELLGAKHPDTVLVLKNLSIVLQGLERYDEAEDLCRQALSVNQEVLGQEHPETLSTAEILRVLEDHRRRLIDADAEE